MTALEEFDSFLSMALTPVSWRGWSHARATVVVARPRRVVEPSRVARGWPSCLVCEVDMGAEAGRRGRYRGLCDACCEKATPVEQAWFRSAVDRWRKWSVTRFHAELFCRGPDPWQLMLYALGKAMVGFGTAPGSEGTDRAGLDELLGHDEDEIMRMCRGERQVPQAVRDLLVERGLQWLSRWRDTDDEDEDEEGADVQP